MQENNSREVITRRASGTAGIQTREFIEFQIEKRTR